MKAHPKHFFLSHVFNFIKLLAFFLSLLKIIDFSNHNFKYPFMSLVFFYHLYVHRSVKFISIIIKRNERSLSVQLLKFKQKRMSGMKGLN